MKQDSQSPSGSPLDHDGGAMGFACDGRGGAEGSLALFSRGATLVFPGILNAASIIHLA
ncbi:MAG TPA: hypothetical protein VHD62_15440 [Opitutaceae bacterium]|nr:hypothetical protein [Opitutaceae bacterium]